MFASFHTSLNDSVSEMWQEMAILITRFNGEETATALLMDVVSGITHLHIIYGNIRIIKM